MLPLYRRHRILFRFPVIPDVLLVIYNFHSWTCHNCVLDVTGEYNAFSPASLLTLIRALCVRIYCSHLYMLKSFTISIWTNYNDNVVHVLVHNFVEAFRFVFVYIVIIFWRFIEAIIRTGKTFLCGLQLLHTPGDCVNLNCILRL